MTLYFYRDTNLYLFVLLSGSRPKSLFWVCKALSGLIPPSFPVSISITLSFPSVPLTVNLFYLFKWAISLPATSSSSCLVAWEGQSSLAHWIPIHLSKYHFLREAFLAFQVGSARQLQTLKTSCTFSLLYYYLINVFYQTWLWASGGQELSQILVIIILTDLVFCLWPHSLSHPFIIYCLFFEYWLWDYHNTLYHTSSSPSAYSQRLGLCIKPWEIFYHQEKWGGIWKELVSYGCKRHSFSRARQRTRK